eukprot:g2352.t1
MTVSGSPPSAPAPDDADNDTAADDERADSLIKGLEAPSDDDDSGNDGDGEVGVANAGAWSALQYATYMTGTLQFVKEKHRVQGYLAAELARAREELGEDDDDEPSKRPTLEGNIDHYSIQKQITRRQNKKSAGFLSAVRMIWDATRAEMVARQGEPCDVGGGNDDSPGIDKAAFVCLMVKVHYLIICPPVDLWTETLASEEYDALAMLIAKGVTTEVEITEEVDVTKAPDGSADSSSAREGEEGGERRTDVAGGKALRLTRSFQLKPDTGITYEPNITKEPVYMGDLLEEVNDEDREQDEVGGDNSPETADERAQGARLTGNNASGGGGKRLRRVAHKRFGGVNSLGKSLPPGSPDFDAEEDGAYAAVSSLSHSSRPSKTAVLSTERVNAQIAKVFAELTGVSVMVQSRPYAERAAEFRPFACSDFVIPVLTRLCPQGEKMDRCP